MVARRDFLVMLGFSVTAAAAPKFIFDMGANLYRPSHEIMYQAWDWGDQHGMAMIFNFRGERYAHAVRIHTPDRYLVHNAKMTAGERAMALHWLLDWKEDKIKRLVLR